jgi:hypothetical protein
MLRANPQPQTSVTATPEATRFATSGNSGQGHFLGLQISRKAVIARSKQKGGRGAANTFVRGPQVQAAA